jgi:glycosyltransferase involved in cell wall biosynthesis
VNVLLVSSFVLPHAGGVEQFVETARQGLCRRGWDVRVLSCRLVTTPIGADATVPTLFLPPAGWPLPVGGWRTLLREAGRADVVVANGPRHLLPIAATLAARLRSRPVLFVLHGSGAPYTTGSFLYHRLLGSVFEWALARPALRLSRPVSVSRVGIAGAERRYGVWATYLPYPLRDLPPAEFDGLRLPRPGEPLRIVWAGRLYPEKDPVTAVEAVERVRENRPATLEIYGEGLLRPALDRLASTRPWLSVRGERSWAEIQSVQARAQVCLSTSARDNVQVGLLEALSRGIPAVSTQVGDAPDYYVEPILGRFCVPAREAGAIADGILELARSYGRYRPAFAANGRLLRTRHGEGAGRLASLIESVASAARDESPSAATAPTRVSAR